MARAVEIFRRNAIELERLLTERKEAAARLEQVVEERTRELERRSSVLRVTFDNMGHGVVMFDRDERMVAWNHRFRELLDLPDQCLGQDVTFEAFVRYLAERGEFGSGDVQEQVRQRRSSLDRPFATERTRPNGAIIELRRNPVPGGGFVSIYADVTEQRRAQALGRVGPRTPHRCHRKHLRWLRLVGQRRPPRDLQQALRGTLGLLLTCSWSGRVSKIFSARSVAAVGTTHCRAKRVPGSRIA